MKDIYLAWGGDLDWAASGDTRMAAGIDLAVQRLARRLFTNPQTIQADGTVVQVGDYLLEQNYGEGLGQLVDQLDTSNRRTEIETRVRSAIKKEYEMIDQSFPPTINFFENRDSGLLGVLVEFTLIDGSRAKLPFEV